MPPNNSAAHAATGYDARTDLAMTPHAHHGPGTLRVPVISGVLVGVLMAAAPLALWWLPAATVYSLGLALIAAVYVGFAVADGRRSVITVEITVATVFVLVAAIAVTASPWLLVAGLAGHGAKDLWQHRTGYVANTRWWPPFCVTADWLAAMIMAVAIAAGASFS
jgi:hypothetical protein